MTKKEADEPELSKKMLDEALEIVKKKNAKKYEFFLKGGNALLDALFKLFKVVWNEEKIPKQWRETTIIQLNKGSNPKNDLDKKVQLWAILPVYKHIIMLDC